MTYFNLLLFFFLFFFTSLKKIILIKWDTNGERKLLAIVRIDTNNFIKKKKRLKRKKRLKKEKKIKKRKKEKNKILILKKNKREFL